MTAKRIIREGRDDTSKLGLGKEGEAYAKMTSKDVMEQPGGIARKVHKRFALQKAVTNQRGVKSFASKDKGVHIRPAFDKAKRVVDSLLDAEILEAVGKFKNADVLDEPITGVHYGERSYAFYPYAGRILAQDYPQFFGGKQKSGILGLIKTKKGDVHGRFYQCGQFFMFEPGQ